MTSDLDILCQKFVEINKDYIFPKFKYNNIDKINLLDDFHFVYNSDNLQSDNEFALNSVKREIKNNLKNANKIKNRYNNFCLKSYNYLKGENCLKDFKEPVPDEDFKLFEYVKLFKTFDDIRIKRVISFMKNTILLSLYFNQYKYLLNLFSYDEVKNILEIEINNEEYNKIESKAILLIDELSNKILKNESIIGNKNELKEIQKYCIYYFSLLYNGYNIIYNNIKNIRLIQKKDLIKFYQIINFLRDFDLCLKIYVFYNFFKLNNKKHRFFEGLLTTMFDDVRFETFFIYTKDSEKEAKELGEGYKMIINKSLNKKDFLIIENKNFKKNFQSIQKELKIDSMKCLKIEDIQNYINEKNENDKNNDKIRVYFYYVIMTYVDFQKNIEKLILLSAELGVTFFVFLYIENESLILKKYISSNYLISVIYVYSIKDVIRYCSNTKNFDFIFDFTDFLGSLDIINPSNENLLEKENEKDYQDGCFELAETFDNKIIENKFVIRFSDEIDNSFISQDIYKIYKEHNALNLFFIQNIKYFGFEIEVEMSYLDICFIKRILYIYCREEFDQKECFYRMINEDLRTKDPKKIDRLIVLLGLLYNLIGNKELASYKGTVYRATKLDENLILKLKPGSTMINITFWSTSKNYEVAERFMKNNPWRNSYIICKTFKTNIDIDYENLNPFNEKEVLIPPFTEFKVEKIYSEYKYNKKIYIIELLELGNKNLVNYDKMNVETINDLDFSKIMEKIFSKMQIRKGNDK